MHILYITVDLPFTSVESFIIPEILEVQRRGHRVTVVPIRPRGSFVHEDARPLLESAITQPVFSLSIVCKALAEIARAPALLGRYARLLAASRNLRIFFKNLAVFPKGLWLADIVKRRAVDHIHAHWAGTTATAALVANVCSGVPWSFTAHRWDISENNLLKAKAQTAKFVRAIDVRGAQELAGIISPNEYKLRVIHMGVAVCPPMVERNGKSRGPLRVLLAARLVEVKGHRYALEAVARLKSAGVDVALHCIGDGPLRVTLEKYATALDVVDRVQFPGLLDHQKLLTQLSDHRWDVALLPSIRIRDQREGIPVFLIEAMAAGLPVVATNTGGISELLEGEAGMVIPERDSKAIADALAKLATDCDIRRHHTDAAVRRIRNQFTIESTVSALLNEVSGPVEHADRSGVS
jgi:glycosyltransferase involved in cell wall biosynthesis